jgi:hypothetical protein
MASDEELKQILLTVDGKGKSAKEAALKELLDRAKKPLPNPGKCAS